MTPALIIIEKTNDNGTKIPITLHTTNGKVHHSKVCIKLHAVKNENKMLIVIRLIILNIFIVNSFFTFNFTCR